MTPYLSRLTSDLDGGSLVALCAIAWAVGIGLLAALVVYGWPALMDWLLPRLARWHSRQVRRANEPQDFPPATEPFPWAAVLLTLGLTVLLGFLIWRCRGVR